MTAVYFPVPSLKDLDPIAVEPCLSLAAERGVTTDWVEVHKLLDGPLTQPVQRRLAELKVYIEEHGGGQERRAPRQLRRHAQQGLFKVLIVPTVTSLGRDLRELIETVSELTEAGVTVVPLGEKAEPVSPNQAGLLREVLSWSRELDREKRSTRIRAGQRKVRAKGKRVGRPKRIFDREEVVRLRDQEHRSWSEIAQELGIGAGTARRAYHELKASRGPAKNMQEVA